MGGIKVEYNRGFVLKGGSKVGGKSGGVKCGVKWGVPCRVGGGRTTRDGPLSAHSDS